MDIYRVGVTLAMSTNGPQVLSALANQLLHVHTRVNQLTGALNRVHVAVGGAFAMTGGLASLSLLGKVVDKGNELVKVQQNMAAAGVKAADIQEAYAKSWELTRKYQNVGAAEIMQTINEARMTFGSQHDATHHVEDFVKMISFLKAFQGGKHGEGASGFIAEANAAMKSGELAGKISPKEMAEHVAQLTAMRVAYGEQLKIGQYLTAQRAGGVALRNTSDEFRYGMFPALVQENGPGAGVMLMTAFNKIVAGTGNRTKSLEHMAKLGLLKPDQLEYNKMGMVKGLKDPSAILNNRDAAINFGDWVMKTLKPMLDKQTTDPIRQAQLISAMFPDRNAAKAITEILQQYTKLMKDAALMAEARKSLDERGYLGGSYEGQKQAFHEQWENFVQALGAPLVATATEHLKRINEALGGMSQWAGQGGNAETIVNIGKGVAVLGAALVAGGGVALLAALGPAGWIAAGIVTLGGAVVVFKPQLESALESFGRFNKGIADYLASLVPKGLIPEVGKDGGSALGNHAEMLKKQMQEQWDFIWSGVSGAAKVYWEVAKASWTALLKEAEGVPTALMNEIKSWPARLTETIAGMGTAIVEAIKGALGGLLGGLFSRTSFEGGGAGMGGLIHKASLGGGANDNGIGRALGGGGGAGGGRGFVDIPASVAMTDAHRNFLGLVGKYESGGRNVMNYIGDRRHTAQGYFQITNTNWRRIAPLLGITAPNAMAATLEEQTRVAHYLLKHGGPQNWTNFNPALRSAVRRGERAPTGSSAPLPSVGAPPRQKDQPIHTMVQIDGRTVARAVTKHVAAESRYPRHVGGMDTRGSWAGPGTTLTDAA